MQSKRILTAAAFMLAALFILNVPAAIAGTQTWRADVVGSGNWSDPDNWTASDGANDNLVPTANDDVVLPDKTTGTYIVTMDGDEGTGSNEGYAQTLTTHADARLDIPTGQVLEIGSADDQTSTIDGPVYLQGSGSTLRFMFSHTVAGDGKIDGENDAAHIEIADSETLTSTTTIEGHLQILPVPGDDDTEFINGSDFTHTGLVHANVAGGTLDINTDVLGAGNGNWEVSTDNAKLEFSVGNTTTPGLGGSFTVSDGTLDIEDHLTGTKAGSLSFTGDYITVDAGVTATFN